MERRKKTRIQTSSHSLAFISDNVTGYAYAFSAAILDVSEEGVGFLYISDEQYENRQYSMELIDDMMHIKNIPIELRYHISYNGYGQAGNKCGATFMELSADQKKNLHIFIERQVEHETDNNE
ncbi:MAG: hypothetical protein H8E41_07100 [Desulfobulbaceae bacterium]|uniref:PilZ domain-containing protein n=1 Tax=Candidatus Desulfobia pelagia TaxID=2841692 RepID=A0A8J6NFC2_9BACT|nr:hypothetical protein [Candidatus Desulfobia pelagia]